MCHPGDSFAIMFSADDDVREALGTYLEDSSYRARLTSSRDAFMALCRADLDRRCDVAILDLGMAARADLEAWQAAFFALDRPLDAPALLLTTDRKFDGQSTSTWAPYSAILHEPFELFALDGAIATLRHADPRRAITYAVATSIARLGAE